MTNRFKQLPNGVMQRRKNLIDALKILLEAKIQILKEAY